MAKRQMDLGLTNHNKLTIVNGDFVVVESTGEHQVQLLLNNKGDFKQNPSVCVGAINYIDDENPGDLVNAIATEFQRDGMDVRSVAITPAGVIQSDAYYI